MANTTGFSNTRDSSDFSADEVFARAEAHTPREENRWSVKSNVIDEFQIQLRQTPSLLPLDP
jgi:hypothetical protein